MCASVVFQRPLLACRKSRLLPSSCGSVGAAVRPAFYPAGLGRPVVSEIGIEASWDTWMGPCPSSLAHSGLSTGSATACALRRGCCSHQSWWCVFGGSPTEAVADDQTLHVDYPDLWLCRDIKSAAFQSGCSRSAKKKKNPDDHRWISMNRLIRTIRFGLPHKQMKAGNRNYPPVSSHLGR